jgi:hypothetical protein
MRVDNPNNLPTIPIIDLLPTQGDLKDLSETNYKKLKNLIDKRGFSIPVYVWEDGQGVKHLLDGHQRRRVLETEGWTEPIPYLKIPAKDLQEAMARLLEITSQYGTITQEGIDTFIAKYELPEQEVYESTSFDATRYGDLTEPEDDEPLENPYSGKIKPPTYEIKGEQPSLIDLTNELKTKELINNINNAPISEDVKAFLIKAAQRHTVFDYAKIAEFYAHTTQPVQDLMEQSALVIIDFDKAIENGFIQMSQEITETIDENEDI